MDRMARADLLPGDENPLAAAVVARDAGTIAMVRHAVEHNRLRLAWQPVVVAADPERVAFHEGLIRVMDPSGRPIPARDFIHAVENMELGRVVDCAALEAGLAALARHPDLRLSVNMSARSVGYPRWIRILKRGLGAHPTAAERLILEITESSALTVPELVMSFIDEWQAEGVRFALDDFGAGFTSFRYLQDFLFDILKIGAPFGRDIHRDRDNQTMMRALIAVGHHLEMLTVAQAVEAPADAEWLQTAGIGCMQGFLFGAPTVKPAWMGGARRKTA